MAVIGGRVLPQPSALSNSLTDAGAKLPIDALPFEILHNLQHQHDWSNLHISFPSVSHTQSISDLDISHAPPTSHPSIRRPPLKLVNGIPPRHSYIHPDLQAHLIQNNLSDDDIPAQPEWVLPMVIGEKWSLSRLSDVFDSLPAREPVTGANGHKHLDAKRILLGMLSHNGMGGDGTVVYYIMHEGDVKPRQN